MTDHPAISEIERFEKFFIPEPNSGCWLWLGNLSHRYGIFRRDTRKPIRAHRVAWSLYRGWEPLGLIVCHHCDTPSCVNPDHLFVGTHSDNMEDMTRKGRHWMRANPDKIRRGPDHWSKKTPEKLRRGERQSCAKLTEDKVRAIRADTRSHREIARDFGVAPSNIGAIKTRKKWTHVE